MFPLAEFLFKNIIMQFIIYILTIIFVNILLWIDWTIKFLILLIASSRFWLFDISSFSAIFWFYI